MVNHFLQTLKHLRAYEELVLYNSLEQISPDQQTEASSYLQHEYREESLNYPFDAPDFDGGAATWGAMILYNAGQLMLYRKNEVSDLESLLPSCPCSVTPGAMLSADLFLRFLPSVIIQLKAIDPKDRLIEVLKDHLMIWHFSGISCDLPVDELSFETVVSDKCLYQLYVDRIIENRNLALAFHPQIITGVTTSMGMFADVYWKDFTLPRMKII